MSRAPQHGDRMGRWTYNGVDSRYSVAGWHLDDPDGPIVLDWMPACDEGCEENTWGDEHYDCCYALYGFPGRCDTTMVDKWLPAAMEQIEQDWDAIEMPDAYRERQPARLRQDASG